MFDNLHYYLKSQFGKDCLQLARKYEKTCRKIADYRNHIRFNLTCRNSNVSPKSLQLKVPVKGHRAENIILRAQKDLINERIRQHHFTLDVLIEEKRLLEEKLLNKLPQSVFDRIHGFTLQAQLNQHNRTKERQKSKYESLCLHYKKESDHGTTKVQDKWVKNLSSKQLTADETKVLARGLNFAVTPSKVPTTEYITGIESAIPHAKLSYNETQLLSGDHTYRSSHPV